MHRLKNLPIVLCFALAALSNAADVKSPRALPENVEAALGKLAPEARPLETKVAENGAIYVLLPNGCEIIVKEKHSAPVTSVQAWVRTGAIHEGPWMGAGLSHFCEHMLFKGTTKRPTGQLDQEIRGGGGDNNAYTTSERTVYHVTGAKEGFENAFAAVADMLMDSTFPPDETVKEHAVVVKEIERYLDNADAVLFEAFERTLFQEHPYRVPVLGYPDRFKRVTREEVFAYYKQRYSPQLTTFIAVGDFDAADVLPKMASVLATWKRNSVTPVTIPQEPEQVAPRSVQIEHPLCEIPKMYIGFPSVSLRDADLYALDLLANILGDGRSSRLYRTVKDKLNLAVEISGFNYTPQYPGYFAVAMTLEPEKIADAKAAVLKLIEEAKTKKPTDEEIARARRKVYTQRIFGQMTADGEAGNLGQDWLVAGDLDFSDRYAQRMQQVSADDILRVARKYLVPEKLNVAIMLPASKDEKPKASEKPVEVKVEENAQKAELEKLRADPSVASAELLPQRSVFEIKLKSGIRLAVREDHSLPVVNMALTALGGTRWEPAELAGASNLMAEMLDRGTQKRSKLKIAEEVEGLGANLSTYSDRNSFGLTIAGLREDAPKLFELASDGLLNSTFPADEFEKLRADVVQEIAQEDEQLFTLNSKVLRPLLYGNHPYARQNRGTIETVKKVTPEDVKRLHQAWVHPENIAVSIVGDVNATDALKLVNQYLGTLKAGSFKAPQVPPVPDLAGGKIGQAEKPGITGAILTLGFRGVDKKNPDREKLDLLAGILSGLGGRLNTALREKLGLAYSVGVYNDTQLDGGAVVFYIQTDAKSLDKSLEGMWNEAKKLREEPVTQKELDSVKNYLAGTEAIELQNQSEVAKLLALSQLYGEGAEHVFNRRERLAKVTAADIKAAAMKYLDSDKFAKAVLKPKE
ncbi:MAG TPA: pitrilysin family protein [Planctomycetota bacterium]|nr:pitrilysin family protein [Planctomycetota bacterium]